MHAQLKMLIVYPELHKTLDCLNGLQWFTSLDLKAGYWQVELDEDSKTLTAFQWVLFGSMNVKGCHLD